MYLFKPGTVVFVPWYSKVLQGEVVPNTTPDDRLLGSMVAVRIPLMGTYATALFKEDHIRTSPKMTETKQAEEVKPSTPDKKPETSPAWQSIQDYKAAHWDKEHNRLCVDSLDEFYSLWHTCIASKYSQKADAPVASTIVNDSTITMPQDEANVVVTDPATPGGDKAGMMVIDTQTNRLLPSMPKPSDEAKNPTKKQCRSTGRIQYRDTVQTSIFD